MSFEKESYDYASELVYQSVLKKNDEQRIPIDATLELTRICSIKCTHCYIGDARWVKNPNELSLEEIKELMDVLYEKGTLWLCLSGGEVTAHKHFREIWLYAKSKGFILTLFTNATLFTDELTQFLVDNPPFRIEVSIYGATREVYEKVSQVKGSFARFIRGLKNIAKSGFNWELKTVLIEDNAKELGLMKSIADDYGVEFKFDGNINPSVGKIGEEEPGGKAPCNTRVDSSQIIDAQLGNEKIKNSFNDLAEYVNYDYTRPNNLYSCGAGKNMVYIDSEGNVQMCVLTPHEGQSVRPQPNNPLRDTMSKSFDWAWDSFGELRKIKLREDSPCHGCEIAALCDNCPGFAHLETGDKHNAVEWLCKTTHEKAERLGIKFKPNPKVFFKQ
jgi:radical SAM protein with 4Fe4S-binding SPASM domain